MGLGLSMVQWITKMHEGKLSFNVPFRIAYYNYLIKQLLQGKSEYVAIRLMIITLLVGGRL